MIRISNISIFGFNDLEVNNQNIIKEFIMNLDFYDYQNKTNLNDLIGQIEMDDNNIYIYFFTSPENNQLEIIINILHYLIDKKQFRGNYTFFETVKYKLQYDN
jgi:hypothetical protein